MMRVLRAAPPRAAPLAGPPRVPPPAPPQPRPRTPEAVPGGQRAPGSSQGGGAGLGALSLDHPHLLRGHLLLALVAGSGLNAQEELRGGPTPPPQ
ncbi:hypothetical protein Q9966_016414 [Columba livia]|nr:hypothetical protein Q9966_016414 [Columba livia]